MKIDKMRIKIDKLRPFFDFRNSLVHRYWIIDDELLIRTILAGRNDFEQFVEETEKYLDLNF